MNMTVGLMVGYRWYTIGTGSFFNSFFSTVYINLEKGKWGRVYPITMNYLYKGEVPCDLIDKGIQEVINIKQEFQKFSTDKVIWNFENLEQIPPWGENISADITNLSNYFVTSEGEDLFDVIIMAYKTAIKSKKNIILRSIF